MFEIEIKNNCMILNNLGMQVKNIGMNLSSNINSNIGIQLGNIGIQISDISIQITNKVNQMIIMMNQIQNNLMNKNMGNQMPNFLMNNCNIDNPLQNLGMNNNYLSQNFIIMNQENNSLLERYKNDDDKDKYSGEKFNIHFNRNGKIEPITVSSDISVESLIKTYLNSNVS